MGSSTWLRRFFQASSTSPVARKRRPQLTNAAKVRLLLQPLEDRVTPAIASLSSGVLTINFASTGTSVEVVTATNDGTNIVLTGDVTGSTSIPVATVTAIAATDSGGSTAQTLFFAGSQAYLLTGGLSSVGIDTVTFGNGLAATGGASIAVSAGVISLPNPASDLSTTGTGTITLSAKNGITLGSGASLTASNQTIALNADNDGDGTGMLNVVSTGTLASGSGTISISAGDVDLNGTISTTGSVTFAPSQAGRPINLGTNAAGALGLTDAELDRITAGTIEIGSTTSGTITVSATITSTNKRSDSGFSR